MVKLKLAFLVIMIILAGIIFVTPLIFPEKKSNKNNHARRIRNIVRLRMGCFLGILILFLLCVVL